MLVQLPVDDARDLEELAQLIDCPQSVGTSRPFDGEVVAQVLVLLGGATFPFFRMWIQGRTETRQNFKVIVNGIEFSGYTATEVTAMLDHVHQQIERDDTSHGT